MSRMSVGARFLKVNVKILHLPKIYLIDYIVDH